MEEQAVGVTVHGPAVFRPLRMELVAEGELGDVAGPGGDPAGLLLQELLRTGPLAHQCVQLQVQMPGQREPERHLSTGTCGGDAPLAKLVRPHLQPTHQAREAARLDEVRS